MNIDNELITSLEQHFRADRANLIAMNAVTANGFIGAATDQEHVNQATLTFSHQIRTPPVTNQKQTGRCWLFAGLNVARLHAMRSLNLDAFELSQSFLMFFDKLEKANFFLNNILESRSEPLDGRLVQFLLGDPMPDAGQWDMFVSLVERYGVVPLEVMPETWSSSRSRTMNETLTDRLRTAAMQLRGIGEADENRNGDVAKIRRETLTDVYRVLCIHLGIPPKRFEWQWRDQSGDFHRDGETTPHEFYERHVALPLDEFTCLINAPANDKEFGRVYTVDFLGNVAGGRQVRYLNVEIGVLKRAAVDSIVSGEAVWFGCDVTKMVNREKGVLDPRARTDTLVYGSMPTLDKGGRLEYGHSRMTHAMVFTGVDLDENGNPTKWRVENSWGERAGRKGVFIMSDAWFDEYVYEVTVSNRFLSPDLLTALEKSPEHLPPWDPMGALAREASDTLAHSAFDRPL